MPFIKLLGVCRGVTAFLSLFIFSVACSSAFAQNELSVHDAGQEDTLRTTVVVAKAKPSPTLQSAPLQVMAQDEFQKLGIKELHEAVKTFSGVQIKDYGGIGGVKTVSVRSMGSQHTAISYDGVTISNAQSGQVDIGRFNLDNVEHVSLTIGQSDDIFQTARMFASAGVLNIKTSRPQFEDDRKANVGAAMKVGSFGTYNPSAYWQQKLSGRWTMALNGDWLSSEGDYPFRVKNGNVITEHIRLNSDVSSFRGEANVYGDLGKGGEVSFKGNWMSSSRGLPGSVVLYNWDARERLWDETWFAQAHYSNTFGEKWELKGQLKYNYAWNKYTDEDESYNGGKRTDYFTQREIYGSASVRYTPAPFTQVVLSQDLFRNTLDASYANFVFPERFTSLTALAARYSSGKVSATASLLSTYITEELRVGQAADDRFRLSPAVSVSYKLFSDRNIRVRASYQDMFRTPTFNDLYYDRVGNRSLNPEIARQFNLGFTWREAFKGVMDEVSLQVDCYYNMVKNKIVALPTMFVWKMMNMGQVQICGADVNAGGAFSFAGGRRLNLQTSYSYQHSIDITDENSKNYRHQIPYTPRHSGTFTASLLGRWVNVGYLLSAVGERYALPQNVKGNLVEGYVEHSLSVGRGFSLRNCKLNLQLECQNFTDVQYDVVQYYPMPGRSFRFTLKFEY